jgi:hypothetical protein
MEPKIFYKKYTEPSTKFQKVLDMQLRQMDLNGDLIFGTPDIDAAFYYIEAVIKELTSLPKYKNISTIKTVRLEKAVYVMQTGLITNDIKKLFGFEKLQ